MKKIQKLTLTLLVCTGVFGFSGVALADDGTPSPAPVATDLQVPAPAPGLGHPLPPFNPDGDQDAALAHQLEARYGHDRDIATPPLIVKQSVQAGKLEAKAIQISHPGAQGSALPHKLPTMANTHITMTSKQTVVSEIKASDFESPATQFVHFVYILMIGLSAILLFLAFGLGSRKGKLKR